MRCKQNSNIIVLHQATVYSATILKNKENNNYFACNVELCYSGIKSSKIPNSAMTASSFWSDGYQPFYAKLDNTGDPKGFWCAGDGEY